MNVLYFTEVGNVSVEYLNKFDFDIDFNHDFTFNSNSTKSLLDISKEIWKMLPKNFWIFNHFAEFLFSIFGATIIWMICEAYQYHINYLEDLRYKNFVINQHFIKLDKRKYEMSKQKILPLQSREILTYVELTSWRLTKNDTMKIALKTIPLILISFLIWIILISDDSAYVILAMIQIFLKESFDALVKNYDDCKSIDD